MQENYYNQNSNYNQNTYYTNQWQQLAYYKMKRKKEKNEILTAGFLIGCAIVGLLILETILSLLLYKFNIYDVYTSSALFQNCFNIIAVHFPMLLTFGTMALILKKRFIAPLVPLKKIGFKTGFLWVCVGMGACVCANFITNYLVVLIKAFGYQLTQPETLDVDSPFACIAIIFSTAIVPGIIEEFSLRCCTLGVLRKYGNGFAVFAVSIVFGLLHANVIQFIFAFLLGLVFGYITIKTESILPAMFIHAFNNGISVVSDIVQYATNEKTATAVVVAVYLTWVVLAVASLFVLIHKKQLLPEKKIKQPKEPYALSFGTKCLCLLPGLAIPFAILIYLTTQYIQHI
jgi:membrane protease YdiL (CAAX protease family)